MIISEIITIGDEILIGQIVDTNSSYIAERLNSLGIRVSEMRSISDNRAHILATLHEACSRADVLIITGGLGPTNDDITKNILAEFTGSKNWVMHEPTLAIIQDIATRRGLPMSELNRQQALVPETGEVLLNRLGTAPGMWFNYQGKIIISMPGVPFEMQYLMTEVLEKLQQIFKLQPIFHRTITTYGIAESVLAERIGAWENALPEHIKLAYLPNPLTGVRLRFSVYQPDSNTAVEVEKAIAELRGILRNAIYGEGGDTLEMAIGRLLQQKGLTVATAESCTGGKIASLITSVAGSSSYFRGGVVAYDNSVKINVLGIDTNTIERYGAVSLQVVQQMAEGARKVLNADYAIATSGIAGLGGGSAEKPVGTVCVAIATPQGVFSDKNLFTGDRLRNIDRSSATALNMLRLKLIEE